MYLSLRFLFHLSLMIKKKKPHIPINKISQVSSLTCHLTLPIKIDQLNRLTMGKSHILYLFGFPSSRNTLHNVF